MTSSARSYPPGSRSRWMLQSCLRSSAIGTLASSPRRLSMIRRRPSITRKGSRLQAMSWHVTDVTKLFESGLNILCWRPSTSSVDWCWSSCRKWRSWWDDSLKKSMRWTYRYWWGCILGSRTWKISWGVPESTRGRNKHNYASCKYLATREPLCVYITLHIQIFWAIWHGKEN